MTEHIRTEIRDSILTLVMARPEKKNALTDAMYSALADAFAAAERDSSVRVILIRGEGDMFTAGNDVGEFAATAKGGDGPRNVKRFLQAISTASKPVVAAVQGRAVGIGTTMLLHCDHVVLAEDAQLITPFVSLALVPEAASSLLLTARIGHLRAFSMFALGDPISAKTALAWGLANTVVTKSELEATAREFAARLCKQPLGSIIATKKLMRATDAITTQIEIESTQFAERLKSAEAQEAFTAFAERRSPDFSRFG